MCYHKATIHTEVKQSREEEDDDEEREREIERENGAAS
jgi:hypothetical protein